MKCEALISNTLINWNILVCVVPFPLKSQQQSINSNNSDDKMNRLVVTALIVVGVICSAAKGSEEDNINKSSVDNLRYSTGRREPQV